MRFRHTSSSCALCAFSCGSAEAAPDFSTFAVDDEGWKVVDMGYLSIGSPPVELSAARCARLLSRRW